MPAEMCWMYYDTASKKLSLINFGSGYSSCLKVHLHQPMLPSLVVTYHHSNCKILQNAAAAPAAAPATAPHSSKHHLSTELFGKVQVLSLDKTVIDFGKDAFAHCQAYVALSRVRNLEGVMLTGLQRSNLNLIDNAVHEEYARLAPGAESKCPSQ